MSQYLKFIYREYIFNVKYQEKIFHIKLLCLIFNISLQNFEGIQKWILQGGGGGGQRIWMSPPCREKKQGVTGQKNIFTIYLL